MRQSYTGIDIIITTVDIYTEIHAGMPGIGMVTIASPITTSHMSSFQELLQSFLPEIRYRTICTASMVL